MTDKENKKPGTMDSFESAKQSIVMKPITVPVQAFIYRDIKDLENLRGFLGIDPKVSFNKGIMEFTFGKTLVKNDSVITRNSYGQIVECLTFAEASEKYEIAAQRDFDKSKDVQTATKKEVVKRVSKK